MKNPQNNESTKDDSYRVLIIEDEMLIALNLQQILEQWGHQVVGIAISYEQSIAYIDKELIDLVLLDIRLYGAKSGIEVAKYINASNHPKPIVFLTSQTDQVNLVKALDTSPAGILSKPIQKESLYTTIKLAMHQFHTIGGQVGTFDVELKNMKRQIPFHEILFFKSEHVYVNIFLNDGTVHFKRMSFNRLHDILPSEYFLQIHRSFIVNKKHVGELFGDYLKIAGHQIPISRSKKQEVKDLFT